MRMPSQLLMDQRLDEILFPHEHDHEHEHETQAGFWYPHTLLNHQGRGQSVEFPLPCTMVDRVGAEKTTDFSINSCRVADQSLVTSSYLFAHPAAPCFTETTKTSMDTECQDDNSLFSSSLSDLFTKKMRLSTYNAPCRQPVHAVTPLCDEEEPFESLEEIEAHTIGNLLPDDKDLLSGVNSDLEYIAQPNIGRDIEDADLFSSGGEMELEENSVLSSACLVSSISRSTSNMLQDGLSSASVGKHPYGEHPSRTLFLRNINSSIEDSELKDLFEKFGDIRTLYTACKHHGFVMISYYDIRAACDAMRTLQDKPLRRRNLDLHFSFPNDNPAEKDTYEGTIVVYILHMSVSNDKLHQTFGVYGEIKEIRENPYSHHKFVEFYDVRAAEAALRALKRTDIAGNHIRVEPCRSRSTRQCSVQISSPELEQRQSTAYLQLGSAPESTLGFFGPVSNGAIKSNCMENGTDQGPHSSFRNGLPISQFMENGLCQSFPPNVPHRSPSPMSVFHSGNQYRPDEPTFTMENTDFSFQGRLPFQPHALPAYQDGLARGVPYSSPGTIATVMSSRSREVTTNEHIHRIGLNENALESNGDVVGSGNGSCPHHGQQYMRSNSNSYQSDPSNPLMWPNTPSYTNGIHVHPSQQLHGLPRPSHMLNDVLPMQTHVGSSPTLDSLVWQRRHVYEGESLETSEFHSGSLGDSSLHQLELNSFPHLEGHLMDLSITSANVGLYSPEKRYHMLPRRHSMIHMSNSFDGNNERAASRRSEVASNQADNKKQYDLNIDLILRGEDSRTTLMIKNIPNKYTSKMLLAAIDEHHRGTYDFIYLPIDFKNKCNVGYAFINMINPSQIVPFYQAFNGKKWEKFNSEKVASLAYARIQGKGALITHFQNSSLMNEDKRCRPILFHSDGPNAGDQEPFPVGVNIRSRPGKHRTNCNEGKHQESPPTCHNGENALIDCSSGSVRDLE